MVATLVLQMPRAEPAVLIVARALPVVMAVMVEGKPAAVTAVEVEALAAIVVMVAEAVILAQQIQRQAPEAALVVAVEETSYVFAVLPLYQAAVAVAVALVF